LQNSKKLRANQYSKKRPWVTSTVVIVIASIAGAFGINSIWLNPTSILSGSADGTTGTKTVTGDAIDYRYGVVQLEVTATNGKIEKISEVQATASSGYVGSFPYLNEMALKAQSADFGNLSGATFSSSAYAKALSSALSKLG
jgi:uncharacterized protein with FMN-binding domain